MPYPTDDSATHPGPPLEILAYNLCFVWGHWRLHTQSPRHPVHLEASQVKLCKKKYTLHLHQFLVYLFGKYEVSRRQLSALPQAENTQVGVQHASILALRDRRQARGRCRLAKINREVGALTLSFIRLAECQSHSPQRDWWKEPRKKTW